ncbi:hypothetical protein EW146_g3633 [Bondarzewia mesenterica]|uniref:Uncharacterized protein n=1 Tax=Bondarzewia mesenterica TaxID=1095465 RepID=A0A4S4LX68_9AGAM|nr:hypothetical protein EW146_g3633 [Bondarzewia mesenterica]
MSQTGIPHPTTVKHLCLSQAVRAAHTDPRVNSHSVGTISEQLGRLKVCEWELDGDAAVRKGTARCDSKAPVQDEKKFRQDGLSDGKIFPIMLKPDALPEGVIAIQILIQRQDACPHWFNIVKEVRKLDLLYPYMTHCSRVAVAATHVDEIDSLGDVTREFYTSKASTTVIAHASLPLDFPSISSRRPMNYGKICVFGSILLRLIAIILEYCKSLHHGKSIFFSVRELEAKRFEEIGSRIRTARMEEEERKKEREIKFTDKIPPAKRARSWNGPSQHKTLFQRTKSEASRIQKSVFGASMHPPMFTAKSYRIVPHTASAKPPPPTTPSPSGSRVVVKTVAVRRPTQPCDPPSLSSSSDSGTAQKPVGTLTPKRVSKPIAIDLSPASPPPRMPKPPSVAKKSAPSSLFMPKHRAHSQLPSHLAPSRGFPTA